MCFGDLSLKRLCVEFGVLLFGADPGLSAFGLGAYYVFMCIDGISRSSVTSLS